LRLNRHYVEKPWGRTELPEMFDAPRGRRVGEVWFEAADGGDLPLLAKYIFTGEPLSIQVHPNDQQARDRGYSHGKSECWYILGADEGAVLGLGLKELIDGEALKAAALDGSIEQLMDWKRVSRGDFFYVPAGTVHAIGAGISLLELQQNVDLTYRLFDYGGPRELHLEEAVAVARPQPYPDEFATLGEHQATSILINGPHFTLVKVVGRDGLADELQGRARWVVPLRGLVSSGEDEAGLGDCLYLKADEPLDLPEDGEALIGLNGALS
jgi:mannose-6-phosphate isomerase